MFKACRKLHCHILRNLKGHFCTCKPIYYKDLKRQKVKIIKMTNFENSVYHFNPTTHYTQSI